MGDLLALAALVVTGFVGGAEFGSFALIQPVIARLPRRQFIDVEQGLLRTMGRVMPVAMTAAPVLTGILVGQRQGLLNLLAFGLLTLALVTTIAVNVGINAATGRWDPDAPPDDWRISRRRWHLFQGIRATLQLLGFITLATSLTLG